MGDEEANVNVHAAVGIALGDVTVTATARTRTNLAIRHLMGAATLSRQVCKIETEHASEPWGGTFYDEMSAPATGVIMMTVAGMESYVNELFADAASHFDSVMLPIWKNGADDFDRKSLLDKADWFLLLKGRDPLDRAIASQQKVQALVGLRNALVHYKPEWSDESARHRKVSDALRPYFSPLKWLSGDPGLFPRAWVTGACTEWAVNSAVAFVEHMADRAGIKPVTTAFADRLKPTL